MSLCTKKIYKNAVADCSTQGVSGIEQVVYVMNRSDIASVTRDAYLDNKVTALTLTTGAKAYKLIGQKQNLSCGSERVVSDTAADSFKHRVSFQSYEFDAQSLDNLDEAEDLVCIVERKDKSNVDGTFLIYGLGTGLFFSSDTYSSNENNGARMLEISSLDTQLERNSGCTFVKTDYATTKSYLEGLV